MRLSRARHLVRVRVTAVAAIAVLLAASLGSVLFVRMLRNSMEGGLASTDEQDIAAIAAQLSNGVPPTQVVITGSRDVVVQLVGANGVVLASDHARTRRTALFDGPSGSTEQKIDSLGDTFIMVAKAVDGAGPVRLIIAGRSTDQVSRATAISIGLLAVTVPLVVAFLSVMVWLSIGRALRPVEAMRKEAGAISSAHQDRRLPIPPGDDEIPKLALTLNEMLDRIQQSDRLQRQFVSDASHELRSPLAVIRQSAEVARAYPDKVSLDELSDDVLAETERLSNLVSALLLLARLDDSNLSASSELNELVDLDDVVLHEAERVRRSARVDVDVSRVSGGQIRGGALLFAQAVRNLLENAARHATSQVCVTLRETGGRVDLWVDDDGNGIPDGERERIFERFVRLDEGRAREEGGAGLGLAIVRNIVTLVGGTISVSTGPLGGARFSISLPAAT